MTHLLLSISEENIILIVCVTVIPILLFLLKELYDKFASSAEAAEVKKELQNRISGVLTGQTDESSSSTSDKESADNVLGLMLQNVSEMKEYYVISKRQARKSFSAALLACLLGFGLFAAGIVISYLPDNDTSIAYSTIGGAIVEVISGLFFWLYSKALDQMNRYHESLTLTQNKLASIEMVKKMKKENRDCAYAYIITKTMDPEQEATLNLNCDQQENAGSTSKSTNSGAGSATTTEAAG